MALQSKSARNQVRPEINLQEYLGVLYRGRWIILGVFAAVFGAVFAYTQLADRTYQATASVKIDTKLMRSTVLGGESASYAPMLNVTQNELEVLKSNAVVDDVAKRLIERKFFDEDKKTLLDIVRFIDPASGQGTMGRQEDVVTRLRGAVEFEPVRESDVIKITATSKNPKEAAILANLYSEAYAERNVIASRSKTKSFREFLESQVKGKQQSLRKTEDDLRTYMEQKGVVSLDDESRKIVEQLSQLEAQRDAVEISIQALERTLTSYSEQVSQQEQNVAKVMGEANDPYIRQLQDQVAQLEVQRDITVSQNPDFVGREVFNARLNEIEVQIQALKAKLKKRTDDFLANLLPGAESGSGQNDPASYLRSIKQKMLQSQIELQSLKARKQALVQAIQDYNRQFEHLPRKNMDFARLQREKMSTEKLYLLIDEKYNEANIAEQSQLGYVEIFDRAVPPSKPSSPKVPQMLLLGIVGGFGLGVVLAFVRDRLNMRVRTPEDLKKHGFHVLTWVKDMKEDLRILGKNGRFASDGKSIDSHLIMASNPMAPTAESYRQLRTGLIHLAGSSAPKTVLVTSPEPGEGKTTTLCNLAIAFAQSGRKVLLVDGDLRRPTINRVFDLALNPGLSEILDRSVMYERAIQETVVANLHVVTSGRIPKNPAEHLGSATMGKFLEDMRKDYDVIFMDSPPALAVTDASVLSSYAEVVIVVVSAGTTSIGALERTAEVLETVGAKVAGVVLNNFNLIKAYGFPHNRASYGNYGYASQSGPQTNAQVPRRNKARA